MTAIHDWSRVDAGLFHHFHQRWIAALSDELNAGRLPDGYFALAENHAGGRIPDVLTLQLPSLVERPDDLSVAVASVPPRTAIVSEAGMDTYVQKANRIVIRHPSGDVVSVIEIVSPGNKSSRSAIQSFVEKAVDLLQAGVHLLIIDLFPPSKRDPQGIHPLIWNEIQEEPFELPAGKPLTLAAYVGGPVKTAYVEPVAVGSELPEIPLFLTPERYVPAPLASSYATTWQVCPRPLKEAAGGTA